MLDFRIETFLTVCETMNFTKAARRLHITQPAVSQHIHALEQSYQTKLFAYAGKQLILTEAGRLFLQTAAAMRHDARHLRDALGQLSSRRYLHFGATLTIGAYMMPRHLSGLLKREPETRIRMIMANTAELLRLLDRGELDFAIVEGFFPKQSYESLWYRTERYLPVCAPDYRFSRSVVRLEDLLWERLLVREPGSGTREVLERALEERNLQMQDFPYLTELGGLDVIKALVTGGMGVSFFYEPVVRSELSAGTLREIPLADCSISHDFSFLWRKGSVFGPYYREVFHLLGLDGPEGA